MDTPATLAPSALAPMVRWLRHERVLLDFDLARLYGVENRALKQAVRRNLKRFPADFLFQLTENEARALVSQSVIPDLKRLGGALPFAFTEQGVAMLSSILRADRAIDVNIAIMRTFVQLRRMMDSNRELSRKISALERTYDEQFATVFAAIKELIALPTRPAPTYRRIGFSVEPLPRKR